MELEINLLETSNLRKPLTKDFQFGSVFSNHMFRQRYDAGIGWHKAEICPYQPISLAPATATFHYGQSFFEGMKAYRRPDGHINLFRPWENMKRFNASAKRLVAPLVDEEEHLSALTKLIELEADWVPNADSASLYIRPFMFSADPFLGVAAGKSYWHMIILSPVGAYFAEGFKPIPIYISRTYRRGVIGGTGDVKAAGNYAASLFVAEEVKQRGYSQVLWLDAIHGKYVEEVGAMNFAVVYNGKHIVTPELSGAILPGITRDSILKLAPDLGYDVTETQLDVDEMTHDIQSGEITEVFGMGTAAVVSPIGKLGDDDEEYLINNGQVGAVTQNLYKTLTDIQYGRVPDERGWTLKIEVNR